MRTSIVICCAYAVALASIGCKDNSKPSERAMKAPSQAELYATDEQLNVLLTSRRLAAMQRDARIDVSSSAFRNGGEIPFRYTDLGEKISPPLEIGKLPDGTRSVVILIEDPDAAMPKPFDHWVLYDLPPAYAMKLREGVPSNPKLLGLGDALQGANDYGSVGYFGPHPPKEHDAHRYYVQVFAIDSRTLGLPPGAKKEQVVEAMQGKVIATGTLMGRFDNNVK
jgi:Raf kinase inhibitor-like YbhB/YbcL family protein